MNFQLEVMQPFHEKSFGWMQAVEEKFEISSSETFNEAYIN